MTSQDYDDGGRLGLRTLHRPAAHIERLPALLRLCAPGRRRRAYLDRPGKVKLNLFSKLIYFMNLFIFLLNAFSYLIYLLA